MLYYIKYVGLLDPTFYYYKKLINLVRIQFRYIFFIKKYDLNLKTSSSIY